MFEKVCEKCSERFLTMGQYEKHMKKHNEPPLATYRFDYTFYMKAGNKYEFFDENIIDAHEAEKKAGTMFASIKEAIQTDQIVTIDTNIIVRGREIECFWIGEVEKVNKP